MVYLLKMVIFHGKLLVITRWYIQKYQILKFHGYNGYLAGYPQKKSSHSWLPSSPGRSQGGRRGHKAREPCGVDEFFECIENPLECKGYPCSDKTIYIYTYNIYIYIVCIYNYIILYIYIII